VRAEPAQRFYPATGSEGRTPYRIRARPNQSRKQQTKERNKIMKTKTSKQPKQTKATVQLKDMKPKKDAKGGAVVGRTTKGAFTGGVFVTATDVGRGN
jgi:hypothetical protein